MKTALPAATKAQKRRWRIIKEELGCIACWIEHNKYVPACIHHLLDTGSRRGHDFTIGLCEQGADHHQGNDGIHRAKKAFRLKYGSDDELLDLTNTLVEIYEGNTV
jgi:hypothetical protein